MKIGFTGDISFDEFTKDYYKKNDLLDKSIENFLDNNDYNVIDFESPITDSKNPTKSALYHKCSPKTLKFIKEKIKNPIFVLGNNHMMDFGIEGLLDTIETLNNENYQYIGAGKNLAEASKYIILEDKVRIGIISIQYKDFMISKENEPGPMHDSYKELIKKRITELKKIVDWVVVVYHGGEEFLACPMPYTRKKLKQYLKYGADIIVAHHPHVVQGYEKIGNKAIFYSLGNFIFDTEFQRAQENTDIGTLLSIDFDKNDYKYSYLNIKIDRKNDKIIEYKDKTNFNLIDKKEYPNMWKNEIYRLSEIRRNKKRLKRTRVNLYLDEYTINDIVPFNYFQLKLDAIELKEVTRTKYEKNKKKVKRKVKKIKKKVKKTKTGKVYNKIHRFLKEKKYRYYIVGKVHRLFKKNK